MRKHSFQNNIFAQKDHMRSEQAEFVRLMS